MSYKFFIIVSFFMFYSCGCGNIKKSESNDQLQVSIGEDFRLLSNIDAQKVLILFPCFPCDAQNTIDELKIKNWAKNSGANILLMDFNRHLWLTMDEKKSLSSKLERIFENYQLPRADIYFGGFSSGGNVSLLMSNFLSLSNSPITPKGVFVVDSPVDMLGLYKSAQETIKKNFSKVAVEEANGIVKRFNDVFGIGLEQLNNLKMYSPYIKETSTIQNLMALKNKKLRFYTEPAQDWWLKERKTTYEYTNAYYIEHLVENLKSNNFSKVELISTKNKGFRANGNRHPHSWSIVDMQELMSWMND